MERVVTRFLRFNGASRHQPQIDRWFESRSPDLALIAREWFLQMRGCGPDVTELLHDGHPTACDRSRSRDSRSAARRG